MIICNIIGASSKLLTSLLNKITRDNSNWLDAPFNYERINDDETFYITGIYQ